MAKSKWLKVKDRTVKGKKTGAIVVNTATGEQVTLLNQHGRYQKFDTELQRNVRYTNDGTSVKQKGLTPGQKAYRAGYKSACIDGAKAYNSKKKGGNK